MPRRRWTVVHVEVILWQQINIMEYKTFIAVEILDFFETNIE